jgi:hypothetical protein
MQLRTKNLADYAEEKATNSPHEVAIYVEDGGHIYFGCIFEVYWKYIGRILDLYWRYIGDM